jgi:dTDP-4-dehydrorhamnose reductase
MLDDPMSKKLPDKTLLITGGSGYLGQALIAKAAETFNVYATYHTQLISFKKGHALPLDITDQQAVLKLITALKPQAIIHTAASNPGSHNEAQMRQINADGSRYVAEGAVTVGARLIHLSTDVVHDGKQGPYPDEAPPTPLNIYGRSKAMAEAQVAAIDPQAVIVRPSLIYGLAVMDRGTAGFVQRLKTGQPLILFNDVIRQPVWVETLIAALLKLIDCEVSGTLNIAGRQALTREEFGRRMLAYWQVETGDLLRGGRAADISDTIPLDLRLLVGQAERILQMKFPGVDEVLTIK